MRIEIAEPGRMTQTGSSLLKLIQNNNMPALDLLVRESIQNSLDARKPDSKFVEVEYITGSFESKRLSAELEGITEQLNRRYAGSDNQRYIAARDCFTEGLTGELDYKKVRDNNYGNLLKLIYEICKPQEAEGAGGSWGLGKTVFFRIGIGLVIYYSRIKTKDGYASRMAASYVEDETSPEALIPVYRDQAKRGIAWWGDRVAENTTQPVTDEQYIDGFLDVFGVRPYTGTETGTTVIIPYIDCDKLISSNQTEYLDGRGKAFTPPWCRSIEEYIAVAVQRWYAPRLNNSHYTHGAFLRLRINGKGLGLDSMEPVFRVIQALYNRGCFVKEDDILTDSTVEVKVESINLRNCLSDTSAGKISFAKVPAELLGIPAPDNKPEPYMYFNCEIRDEDVNRPTVCFTRKPAMIVSYENVGAWASNITPTAKGWYIIAVFVLNSWNNLKNSPTPRSLEEYVRRSEMADHTSWGDWSEGTFNPRIVTKIQSGVNKTISKEFAQEQGKAKPKANSGLGKLLGEMLLPPDGFGKRPGPDVKPGGGGQTPNRRGISFSVISDRVRYQGNTMIIPLALVTSAKKKISNAAFDIQIESEAKRLTISEWENKLGMTAPVAVNEFRIEIDTIDGQRVSRSLWLDNAEDEVEYSDIRFSKRKSSFDTCYGLKISSETPHSMKMKITAVAGINRRDVRPAFVFEKE